MGRPGKPCPRGGGPGSDALCVIRRTPGFGRSLTPPDRLSERTHAPGSPPHVSIPSARDTSAKAGGRARPVPPGARAAQPRARATCQAARRGGLSFSVETPPPNNPGRLNGENRPPAGHSRGGALNGRRRGCGGDHERQAIAGKAGSGFTAVRPVATPPRGSCPRQTERPGATPRDCVISQEPIPHATRVTEQGGSRPRRPGRTGARSDTNGQRAQTHVTVLSFSARPERPGPRSGSMITDKRTRAALEQRQSPVWKTCTSQAAMRQRCA